MEITLPDSLRPFLDEQVAKGSYGNAGEYVQELITEAREREEESRLEELLLAGLASGPPIEVTEEYWQQKRAMLLERHKSMMGH